MKPTLPELLAELRLRANREHDGHFTILSFTSHYKVFLGTANLYGCHAFGVHELEPGKSLEEAIVVCLRTGQTCTDFESKEAEDRHIASIKAEFEGKSDDDLDADLEANGIALGEPNPVDYAAKIPGYVAAPLPEVRPFDSRIHTFRDKIPKRP
jgi:hypothetical protein